MRLRWQSKTVLLLVAPAVGANLVLQTRWWSRNDIGVAIWTLGLSALLGLVAWKLRSATAPAAAMGFAITATMMFATMTFPYRPWRNALLPVMAVLVLTALATRLGRSRKEKLGTAENRKGRSAAQVAANLGIAALLSSEFAQTLLANAGWLRLHGLDTAAVFAAGLAALCEAAADTVSSELGQVLSSQPRMITTLRAVAAGTDGAISLGGTAAGLLASGVVATAGALALDGGWFLFMTGCAGGAFGLFFDSLLGATIERRGWLNNDAVNFLSTASAAGAALVLLAVYSR